MSNIILIIIIIILFFITISIELIYNINMHQILNPNLYTLPGIYINNKKYTNNIIKGINIAKNSSIVICSLARNISNIFETTKTRFEFICSHFANYKIVLFENDSIDDSRELLKKWSNQNSNVILLDCCDINNCNCEFKYKKLQGVNTERLGKMAYYRQQYLNYLIKNLSNYDYMLVADFDLDGNTNMNGIFDSLSFDNWGAISCNGKTILPGTFGLLKLSYDGISYIFEEEKFDDNHLKYISPYDRIILMTIKKKGHFFKVKSAFNGYTLYKIKSLIGCSYIGDDKLCEHVNLAQCLYNKNENFYINSFWTGYFNTQGIL